MKFAIALLWASLSSAAFATDLCTERVICGHYEHGDNSITFTDLGNGNVNWVAKNPGGGMQTQILEFEDDGTFTLDHNRALGYCENNVCHLSGRPLINKDGKIYTQIMTLKFLGDSVEMEKVLVYADGNIVKTTASYAKTSAPGH